MGGMRELHAQDPAMWTPQALGQRFGISYEAVKRILRSKWAATTDDKDVGKWSRASDGVNSPVPQIRAVYELKRANEAQEKEAKESGDGKGKEKVKQKEVGETAKKAVGKGWGKSGQDQVGISRSTRGAPPFRQRGGFGLQQ
ncbi:hypothetical protein CC85DRAFT_260127 [Cutaneotrichosporon oleaginosum]|uniref:Required for respiratory growth protein 9, mitochondrial n=1 Tax=Cutaneotrichosporon oleaginosum TaxID=879819 RepID=A0A0J0XN07_9TREE|nr:uncharacterized protein CC85DRAFT_260127 [Cutaneotrichosporon oleaginosum]KLT42500.1 hypothetical protein CC85DRAFT_260127 [Cutaneotrichosporon oleaginosum]TXT07773.1 hypothetical protein COLE_04697 [Cutaneotrichosporon oleaginosum]